MPETSELIARIQDADDKVRCAAWLSAGDHGAAAVKPLAGVLDAADPEVRRAARNALLTIVRRAGRPGAAEERRAVEAELCGLLGPDRSVASRRQILWMVSEIGGDAAARAIGAIPGLLEAKDLREDARCALQRIPGDASLAGLRALLAAAPEDFQPAVAAALRARGADVPGVPDHKLAPAKETAVRPVGG